MAMTRVPSSPRADAFLSISSSSRARPCDLALTHPEPDEPEARALVELEREPEALLDLDAALEQAGRDLARPRLGLPDASDRNGHEQRVPDALGLLEGGAPIVERSADVVQQQPDVASPGQDPRAAHVVAARLGQGLVAQLDGRPRIGAERRGKRKEHVGSLETGRHSASNCWSVAAARSTSPARRWKVAACRRRRRARPGSAGVRSAASSESSAAAPVAPRAAAARPRRPARTQPQHRGPRRRGRDGGPAPRRP